MSASYSALFGKSYPSFKDYAPKSDLCEKLKRRLKTFQDLTEREENRNINYVLRKLEKIKREIKSLVKKE